MELLRELLNEASRPMRAWDGKLKNIDALLFWLYDKNLLSAADKDKVFHAYYRYYNDGDFPRALSALGISKWGGKKAVEQALEEYLEKFIKEILVKYAPVIDRNRFRLDTFIRKIDNVIDASNLNDPDALITYWIKTVKITDEDGVSMIIKNLVEKLEKQAAELKEIIINTNPKMSSKVLSFAKSEMEEAGEWTPRMERMHKALCVTMAGVTSVLEDLKHAAEAAVKALD